MRSGLAEPPRAAALDQARYRLLKRAPRGAERHEPLGLSRRHQR